MFPHCGLGQSVATAYPTRPVTMVVPFAPGGPVDREARLYSAKMGDLLTKALIVDYKPGAGTSIGSSFVAKSRPDGHTLLINTTSYTAMAAFYKDIGFDPVEDMSFISLMKRTPSIVIVHPSFPATNFREYIAYAKANPDKINVGNSGIGATGHLALIWLANLTDTKVTLVHYKGAGPQIADLVAGRLDSSIVGLQAALALIKAGKVRPLAVTGSGRSRVIPALPTIAESGVPEFNYANWSGIFAPSAVPSAVLVRLNEIFNKLAKNPEVASPLEADGSVMEGTTSAAFRKVIIEEIPRWSKIVSEAGVVPGE